MNYEEKVAKSRERAARGERYRQWLEDEGLGKAFDDMRSQYLKRASFFSTKKPERAVRLLQAADIVNMVKDQIELTIMDGKIEKSGIKRIADFQSGKKKAYF